MAYTPHTWECGETITAELLNNIEGGVQEALGGSTSAPLIVTVDRQTVPCEGDDNTKDVYTYNHSWQEIHDALLAKRPAYMAYNGADEGSVGVALESIVGAYHELTLDEYQVQGSLNSYLFSDANSLVYETECSK